MKKRFYIFGIAAIVTAGSLLLVSSTTKKNGTYQPRSTQTDYSTATNEAMNYYHAMRVNQNTGTISIKDVLAARQGVEQLIKNNTSKIAFNWQELGPDNMGGRVRALLVDRNNPNLLFAGSVGGGLWKSTSAGMSWTQVNYSSNSMLDMSMSISCIAQGNDGAIYFGTGEGLSFPRGVNGDTSAFIGRGIWKSTDGGNTFTQLTSTIPTSTNSLSAEWAFINKIAIAPNGYIYASTNKGLRMSTNGGSSWTNPIADNDSISQDVVVASDNSVAAVVGKRLYLSTNNGASFNVVYTNPPDASIKFNYYRMAVAFAPSNPNYMYVVTCNDGGTIKGVFRSTNKGGSWSRIAPANSSNFNIFGGLTDGANTPGSGWHSMVITVFPDNPEEILLGGVDMWYWKPGSTWTTLSSGAFETNSPYYVHSGHHAYYINPANTNFIYVATDGGIFTSTDRGQTWRARNKNLNICQFNTIATSPDGFIMGGVQNNGVLYMDFVSGNTAMNAKNILGSSNAFGGHVNFSYINPAFVMAALTSTTSLQRSADHGASMQSFGGDRVKESSIFPPTLLWETTNNPNSTDYINYINREDWTLTAGTWIKAPSRNNGYPIWVVLPHDLPHLDTFKVKDVVQTKFFFGLKNEVWMTKDALVFATSPRWSRILRVTGGSDFISAMDISVDGNYLYVGSRRGVVYRISNVLMAEDSITADEGSNQYQCHVDTILYKPNRVVTSINVDINNPQNVIVTYGNYGNTDYIFYTTNAVAANPTFTSVQGNLPPMPVYASQILLTNSNTALVGTELGLFVTTNLGNNTTWEYAGMGYLPVSSIKQQNRYFHSVTNFGNIYVGTQGRGAWRSSLYYQNIDEKEVNQIVKNTFKVFPNPATEFANISFTAAKSAEAKISIIGLNGQVVKSVNHKVFAGNNNLKIDINGISKGLYLVEYNDGTTKAVSKLMIQE